MLFPVDLLEAQIEKTDRQHAVPVEGQEETLLEEG